MHCSGCICTLKLRPKSYRCEKCIKMFHSSCKFGCTTDEHTRVCDDCYENMWEIMGTCPECIGKMLVLNKLLSNMAIVGNYSMLNDILTEYPGMFIAEWHLPVFMLIQTEHKDELLKEFVTAICSTGTTLIDALRIKLGMKPCRE